MRFKYRWKVTITGTKYNEKIEMPRIKQMLRMSYEHWKEILSNAQYLLSVGRHDEIPIPISLPCGQGLDPDGIVITRRKPYGQIIIRREQALSQMWNVGLSERKKKSIRASKKIAKAKAAAEAIAEAIKKQKKQEKAKKVQTKY